MKGKTSFDKRLVLWWSNSLQDERILLMRAHSDSTPKFNKFPPIRNLSPSVWGNHAWKFLHCCAMAYEPSPENAAAFKQMFDSLQVTLPCAKCRDNFSHELQTHPLDDALQSKEALNRWLTNLHNSVNRRLGKREIKYEDVLSYCMGSTKKMKKSRATENPNVCSDDLLPYQWAVGSLSLLILILLIVIIVISTSRLKW